MQCLLRLVWLPVLSIFLVSCGDSTAEHEPPTGDAAPTSQPTSRPTGPAKVIVAGSIELEGELAEGTAGALHVVGTAAGLQTPLVTRANLSDGTRTKEGTLLVPFVLHSRSGMLAASDVAPESLPTELALKVSFSPDGYVETIERWHDHYELVAVGDEAIQFSMKTGERPTSRPTGAESRPTSRPVAPAGD